MEYIMKIGKNITDYIYSLFFKDKNNTDLQLLLLKNYSNNIGKEEIDNFIDDVIIEIRNEKNMKELEYRYLKFVKDDDNFLNKKENFEDDDADGNNNDDNSNGKILLLV
jgi:hypothetical protein